MTHAAEIEQIRARHTKVKRPRPTAFALDPFCDCCDVRWPCDASLLLAALSEAEALRAEDAEDNDYAVEVFAEGLDRWRERAESAEARLEAVEGALKGLLAAHQAIAQRCGFTEDEVAVWSAARKRAFAALAQEQECSNCNGRKCMGCVLREWDHECADDCPFCCLPAQEHTEPQEAT